MLIHTEQFGELTIPDEDILYFADGLYGFEGIQRYVLLHDDDPDNPFVYLQAVDYEKPCFIVLDPLKLSSAFAGYVPTIPEEALTLIGDPDERDIRMLVVAVIRDPVEDSTVNLRSPILINAATNEAMQFALLDNEYGCRHRLFAASGKEA